MPEPKTPDEIRGMIAYYRQQIERTTSADRIRRAHVRIKRLQRELETALRVRGLGETQEGA